jgi:integrase
MANITRDGNSLRIQFISADGKRQSIRLGKVREKVADQVRGHVEQLAVAKRLGTPLDPQTAKWVSGQQGELADKLAAVGLIAPRAKMKLGEFIDGYVAKRGDLKGNTLDDFKQARGRLLEFIGADTHLSDVTAGQADDWRRALLAGQLGPNGRKYAASTVGKWVQRIKQVFKAAVRAKLIGENPFADLKRGKQTNKEREHFITREEIGAVFDACPDDEWRLIFALSRYGGLRIPSELVNLAWSDILWDRGRMLIHSAKTEHHQDGGERWCPIFPELLPFLEVAFDQAEPGTTWVISRYCRVEAIEARRQITAKQLNLGTAAERIIRRAGLTPWAKVFHNMRGTRQTELEDRFPTHVVCAWLGNSESIARKHYLRVTEDHFDLATGAKSDVTPSRNDGLGRGATGNASTRTDPHETTEALEVQGFAADDLLPGAPSCVPVRVQNYPQGGYNTSRFPVGKRTPTPRSVQNQAQSLLQAHGGDVAAAIAALQAAADSRSTTAK